MPGLDGVEATRQIMVETPCAILLVTASVSGNMAQVFEAMGYGALDVVKTPVLGFHGHAQGREPLMEKITTIGKLIGPTTRAPTATTPHRALAPLVVLGASTGGPMALAAVLSHLPADFPAAVVVVQHVDAQFSAGLATWLNNETALGVELALVGSRPTAGTIWVAGTNHHLVLTADLGLAYTPEPRSYLYRPSIDVFFNSVAHRWPGKGVGILLTGMGHDGASGLLDLRQAGWHTLAQDRASSVVYGMPKAAAELGAAVEILALENIGPQLASHFA
jgi:two-component system response regulator WspF